MSFYEDFFCESGEFDEQIEELKSALAKSVKQEITEEMEALRKENAELREFRDKKQEYERELSKIKHDYAVKMQDAEQKAKRARLNDLLSFFSVEAYRAHVEYTQLPKCDKCDSKRRIHFKSPSGRDFSEDCACAKKRAYYYPKSEQLFKFYVDKNGFNSMYYTQESLDDDDRFESCSHVYEKNQEPFEKLNRYYIVFLKKENCQKYCDWLNERQKKEDIP